MTWSRRFDDPIPLAGGRALRTLNDAAHHVQSLPKAEQARPHWQFAIEMLIAGAERGPAWCFLARAAMLQALHHGRPEPDLTPRHRPAKKYRLLR